MSDIKFAIITPTYWKLDGSTGQHLLNTLKSVAAQTYRDYKLYLIGDDYQKEDELYSLSEVIDKDKIYVENLPVAIERTKYSGRDLWACGGHNASNVGMMRAIKEGYCYMCHLDHDDIFFSNHLETIARCIVDTGTHFVTTKCGGLPDVDTDKLYTDYLPASSKLYHVSACYDFDYYPIMAKAPEERKKIYGHILAGDADVWNQINKRMRDNNECGIFVNKKTCRKTGGQYPILQPEIVK